MEKMEMEGDVKAAKPKKEDHRIRNTLADFGSNTTAHGFARVVAADSKILKFLWVLVCCLCWGVFIWQAIDFIEKYFRFEVTYSISVDFRELPFPAVTVCNMNPLRQSELDEIDDKYKEKLGFLNFEQRTENETDEEFDWAAPAVTQQILNVSGEGEEEESFEDFYDLDHVQGLNLSAIMSQLPGELRARIGHQKEDLIQECSVNGVKCSSKNFTLVLNPKYGNCYSFNTGANDTGIIRTSKPGPSTGLRLTLFIEQDEYLDDITENAGAVVLVHPPDNVPFPEEQGLELPPGFSTSLGVRLSIIQRVGGKYSDCFKGDEKPLLYEGYNYSVEACVKTCHQKNLIEECQCYDTTLPNDDLTILPCVDKEKGITCMNEVAEKQKIDALGCRKNCHQPCRGRSYKETLSMSQWPSDAYDNKLYKRLSEKSRKITEQLLSVEESRRNLIKLKVYFSELNFESITEKPAFGRIDLLSSLGGLMGLYIGASVISLFEFLEFVGKVCCLIPKKRNVLDDANTKA
ncbi:amiloride-sensitive sodium channel subunit gamma-like [Ptychodera flava]|uniref:amiloride-sensitive sodium channel subunit gamma-like n=1 Tax=Ptychodera flava TaxID=63121 RepID=UPI003969EEDB